MFKVKSKKGPVGAQEPVSGPPPLLDREVTLGRDLAGERLHAFLQIGLWGADGLPENHLVLANGVDQAETVMELIDMALIAWSGRSTPEGYRVFVLTEEGRRVRRRIKRVWPGAAA